MGTSRCWQEDIIKGFHQRKTRKAVAERKKTKRLEVRRIVKELKAAGKKVDLQAINHDVVNKYARKRQGANTRNKV